MRKNSPSRVECVRGSSTTHSDLRRRVANAREDHPRGKVSGSVALAYIRDPYERSVAVSINAHC